MNFFVFIHFFFHCYNNLSCDLNWFTLRQLKEKTFYSLEKNLLMLFFLFQDSKNYRNTKSPSCYLTWCRVFYYRRHFVFIEAWLLHIWFRRKCLVQVTEQLNLVLEVAATKEWSLHVAKVTNQWKKPCQVWVKLV